MDGVLQERRGLRAAVERQVIEVAARARMEHLEHHPLPVRRERRPLALDERPRLAAAVGALGDDLDRVATLLRPEHHGLATGTPDDVAIRAVVERQPRVRAAPQVAHEETFRAGRRHASSVRRDRDAATEGERRPDGP